MQTKLIPPQTLAAIQDLSLVARMVVEGFMGGQHHSRKRGTGLEFSQYRSYQPGDDLRQLDWKMFARSDRYYIREADTDTNLRVQLVVDGSNSMNHEEMGIRKITYARLVLACLGYLAARQGDDFALYVLQENHLVNLLPASNAKLPRFWLALEKVTATGNFAGKAVGNNLLQAIKQKTITVFLSDMYEQDKEITELLFQLRSRGQEVLLLQLLGPQEKHLRYQGNILFEDLETGKTIQFDPVQHRQQYEQHYQAWLDNLATTLRQKQIAYGQLMLDEPLDKALRLFLKTRENRL